MRIMLIPLSLAAAIVSALALLATQPAAIEAQIAAKGGAAAGMSRP
jgi:hypothetical protein